MVPTSLQTCPQRGCSKQERPGTDSQTTQSKALSKLNSWDGASPGSHSLPGAQTPGAGGGGADLECLM